LLGHDTLFRLLPYAFVGPVALGLDMMDQLVPFQRSTNVLVVVPSNERPTAKQVVGLGHDTPFRTLSAAPVGLGLVTMDQLVPFQRSANVLFVTPSS
jgi:hypothetical protein